MAAGKLRSRLLFQRREVNDDGYGNEQSGPFVTQFTAAAEVIPLKGSESVLAARLTGTQPVIIRVRSCADTRAVTAAWRAVDARDQSRAYNISSVADMDQKNAMLDVLATSGVAT